MWAIRVHQKNLSALTSIDNKVAAKKPQGECLALDFICLCNHEPAAGKLMDA
jgi:hypothetical protein